MLMSNETVAKTSDVVCDVTGNSMMSSSIAHPSTGEGKSAHVVSDDVFLSTYIYLKHSLSTVNPLDSL